MKNITVDPEFQGKIPPLTEAEYKQLEENIVSDGEIYEPIVTWNDVIVDGHNRWKIHLAHPEIPYRIKEVQFADKWDAFDWMYRKQLGRRNLTDEQRTYLLGKLYESRKKTVGFSGNRDASGKFQCAQNGHIGESAPKRVSEMIAEEMSVGAQTVKRSEHFSKGIDALKEISPQAAQMVLEHKVNVPKSTIAEVRKLPEEELKQVAQTIERGEAPKKPNPPVKSVTPASLVSELSDSQQEVPADVPAEPKKKSTHDYSLIDKVYNEMVTGSNLRDYTVDDLISEIQVNADNYVSQLRQTLAIRSTLLTTSEIRARVKDALESIQNKIKKVSELL